MDIQNSRFSLHQMRSWMIKMAITASACLAGGYASLRYIDHLFRRKFEKVCANQTLKQAVALIHRHHSNQIYTGLSKIGTYDDDSIIVGEHDDTNCGISAESIFLDTLERCNKPISTEKINDDHSTQMLQHSKRSVNNWSLNLYDRSDKIVRIHCRPKGYAERPWYKFCWTPTRRNGHSFVILQIGGRRWLYESSQNEPNAPLSSFTLREYIRRSQITQSHRLSDIELDQYHRYLSRVDVSVKIVSFSLLTKIRYLLST